MGYEVYAKKGWVNRGNLYRLKEVMKRAEAGDRMTLAFLGGSITQGSLSSEYTNCYAYLVFDWFVKKFPKTAFTYVNAGVGGTTSQFGVSRAEEDVLKYKPDLVMIEFSVNDDNTDFYKETYEGLVRKIYGNAFEPAVVLIHNICYDTGISAEEKHREIGAHYMLPSVSMKPTIYAQVMSGAIPVREVTPDDLHPNTTGHALLAQVISHFLEDVYAIRDEAEEKAPVPAALTVNSYEKAARLQNHNFAPLCKGFTPDGTLKKYISDTFRGGWTASEKGASITFEVKGTEIAVQYRKSVNKPAPIALAIVDGDEEHAVTLDANFEETWGDSLTIETVAHHINNGPHTVEIRLTETHEEDAVPFYLTSVIVSA
ncbi:MAG: SGNH/GDSL hydrolase family protein [Roseburia sp.]|nr:SGNH/GDSL hydrolase family protein [Roseburia sp.]MCM1242218.1 SGNH/GDSL hydrolase family protein [Roseburia sp.]